MITRIATLQAHRVPSHVYYAGPIFSPDVLREPVKADTEVIEEEDQGTVTLARCTFCGVVLRMDDTPDHECD